MKKISNPESEVMSIYEAYWDSYLKGDMETMASCIDDDFKVIGTTEGEIFFNKKEVVAFYKSTADQITGNAEMRNRQIEKSEYEGLILITERCDLYILIEGDWVFYSKARITSLLRKKGDSWKFVQQHGSLPDSRTQDGEQLALEKIKNENFELRDAVKRRTAELENKNHELEIEAALERIRAKAMAMRNSDEIGLIVKTVFDELKKFGFETIRCGIGIFEDRQTKKVNIWSTTLQDKNDIIKVSGDETLEGHPLLDGIYTSWKNKQEFSYILEGEDLKEYYKTVAKTNFQLPDYPANSKKQSNKKHYYYLVNFKTGGLYAFR